MYKMNEWHALYYQILINKLRSKSNSTLWKGNFAICLKEVGAGAALQVVICASCICRAAGVRGANRYPALLLHCQRNGWPVRAIVSPPRRPRRYHPPQNDNRTCDWISAWVIDGCTSPLRRAARAYHFRRFYWCRRHRQLSRLADNDTQIGNQNDFYNSLHSYRNV